MAGIPSVESVESLGVHLGQLREDEGTSFDELSLEPSGGQNALQLLGSMSERAADALQGTLDTLDHASLAEMHLQMVNTSMIVQGLQACRQCVKDIKDELTKQG